MGGKYLYVHVEYREVSLPMYLSRLTIHRPGHMYPLSEVVAMRSAPFVLYCIRILFLFALYY